MADKLRGKDFVLYASKAGKMYPVCCGRELSISINSELIEATKTPQSRWKSWIYGDASYSVSSSAIVILDGSFTLMDFYNAIQNKTTFTFLAKSNTDTNMFFSGNLLLTSIDIASPYKDVMTYTIAAQGDGNLNNINPYHVEILTDENGNPITDENNAIIYTQDSGSLPQINLDINC